MLECSRGDGGCNGWFDLECSEIEQMIIFDAKSSRLFTTFSVRVD